MYTQILENVCKKINLTKEEQNILIDYLEIKEYSKRSYLLKEGDICNFEGYINKGCVRKYYINEHGNEFILQFAIEDWWISDIASFHEQKASKLFIETLDDSQLFILTPSKKEELLKKVPKLERFFRLLVQKSMVAGQNRLINTVSKTAEEKYLEFIKIYPTIPQRVPQHLIASYLGISAEFLSKVRTRLSKK
ncbi:Crp/Fnr family transcriptional regulator [Flavobacterium sp. J27]|uniref:Crp/Fnr family transcriptional regulator n=1 Tax=Flavobacterium sp. J27 TaxID=2060419 RepID=UPI0010301CC2|nr:Crp/Fnr family transcriptional regulator [Flavobacterium sp. J27]